MELTARGLVTGTVGSCLRCLECVQSRAACPSKTLLKEMQMTIHSNARSKLGTLLLIATTALSSAANASIVRIETVLGDIEINLYDNATPATVANFLNYVQTGAYTDSIFHRSVSNFIIQGGGFVTDMNAVVTAIPANAAVTNEPVYSNVRGSIAMAKLGGGPDPVNSATNQWFINLSNNNASNLDNQNGGFTVFGEVTAGLDIVDALADLPTFAAGQFTELPLRDYTAGDPVTNLNLAIVTAITVIDTTPDSAGVAGLTPTPTTAGGGGTGGGGTSGGGGGGSLGLIAVLALLLSGARQALMRRK